MKDIKPLWRNATPASFDRLSVAAIAVFAWFVVFIFLTGLSGCAGEQLTPTTLATIEQSATLATQAADTYVVTANPDDATRLAIAKANKDLDTAVISLEAAPANSPLDLTAFNAALAALAAAGVPVKAPAQ